MAKETEEGAQLRSQKLAAIVILNKLKVTPQYTKDLRAYLISQDIYMPVRKFMRCWLKKMYYTTSTEDTRGVMELVYYLNEPKQVQQRIV